MPALRWLFVCTALQEEAGLGAALSAVTTICGADCTQGGSHPGCTACWRAVVEQAHAGPAAGVSAQLAAVPETAAPASKQAAASGRGKKRRAPEPESVAEPAAEPEAEAEEAEAEPAGPAEAVTAAAASGQPAEPSRSQLTTLAGLFAACGCGSSNSGCADCRGQLAEALVSEHQAELAHMSAAALIHI